MNKNPCVYIVTNKYRGTLYIGVTSSILHRSWQHRSGKYPGFTAKYRLKRLVYFEFLATFPQAIMREKQLKRWKREWKIELIEKQNPAWLDLYATLV